MHLFLGSLVDSPCPPAWILQSPLLSCIKTATEILIPHFRDHFKTTVTVMKSIFQLCNPETKQLYLFFLINKPFHFKIKKPFDARLVLLLNNNS